MASKVGDLLKVMGNYNYEPGAHMYHAAESTMAQGGAYDNEKRHRIRKTLAKIRLKASGMSDSLAGSKETDGAIENPFEQLPKE